MKKDGGNYGQVAPTLVKQINNIFWFERFKLSDKNKLLAVILLPVVLKGIQRSPTKLKAWQINFPRGGNELTGPSESGGSRGHFPPDFGRNKNKTFSFKELWIFGFLFALSYFQIFLRSWVAQDFFLWVRRLYRRRLKGTSILQNSALVPSSSLYSLLVVLCSSTTAF